MTVYRIAKKRYIHDLSGEGARLYGGRWNRKGTSLLYTSQNRSLATVEYLVHLPMTLIPKDMCIAAIEVPADFPVFELQEKNLPALWATWPAPVQLSLIMEELLQEDRYLSIKVPSAVVEGEFNILVNPRHRGFQELRIIDTRNYHFDDRLIQGKEPLD
jgi:RES domain-containing protein